MPRLSQVFLFFLIKLVLFGSSYIVIHVSGNDHFCPGFFFWAAIIVKDYLKMQIFISGLFPELTELSCHQGWFHLSARPAYKYQVFLTSLYTSKRLFLIFMSISKCSIESIVLENIVGPAVAIGLWLTATNIHNPFHLILDFCNSLIAVFDIESGWETFSRIMYMGIQSLTWQNSFRVREDWMYDNFDKIFYASIHVVTEPTVFIHLDAQ